MPAGSSLIAIFDIIARRSDGQGLDMGERGDSHARFMSKVLLLTLLTLPYYFS